MKQRLVLPAILFLAWTAAGCAPAAIGAGAAGAVKVGTDQRTIGQQWSDGAITAKVKTALIQDPGVSAMRIDVDTVNQVVYLSGLLASEAQVQRAEEVAWTVSGIEAVENNLRAGSRSFGESLDDKALGTKLRAKLAHEPDLYSLNVDVDVNKGVVSLTGILKDRKEKERVLEIVRAEPGVAEVIDNLGVKR